MARPYVPDAGDIVWISFSPQSGHRPAVVLSPAAYNAKTSLMVCCPMTTQVKNYPFEVLVTGGSPSAVLADQVKSLDWRKRRAKRKGTIPITRSIRKPFGMRASKYPNGLKGVSSGSSEVTGPYGPELRRFGWSTDYRFWTSNGRSLRGSTYSTNN